MMDHLTKILKAKDWLNTQIIGQEHLVDRILIALLSDGHLLVEGAPGLAKTKAIKLKDIKMPPSRAGSPDLFSVLTASFSPVTAYGITA